MDRRMAWRYAADHDFACTSDGSDSGRISILLVSHFLGFAESRFWHLAVPYAHGNQYSAHAGISPVGKGENTLGRTVPALNIRPFICICRRRDTPLAKNTAAARHSELFAIPIRSPTR